ncbi:DUF4190 domain-containing protein [Streptomyces natalensis]|uniref:DUF4352 domain-containing protein n=1 Tax=Streptomyces natalensis ATCC 27448 TaxID=1240678 RepID=A0A0D7CSD6_9ACTN|nr:DUF4190 domain-containing protein [Streptomyces natalensis]KIZ19153.1 hypothetical protein SNA_04340 [Streptomyces natalensis ATCC 27448]
MSQQMNYQSAPMGAPAPQAARNGLGVAALVLGIIGFLSGLPMFLFWLAGPLGLLALIFGIVGTGRAKKGQATNKGAAITGTVLGALAIVLAIIGVIVSVLVVKSATETAVDEIKKQNGSSNSVKDLKAGAVAKYNNGLQVTVSKPSPYTVNPNTLIDGHTNGNKAWKVTVTIKNTGGKDYTNPLMTTDAEADGKKTEEVGDDKHGILHHDFEKTLSPNESSSVEMVFDAPPSAKELELKITPDLMLVPANWKLAL